MDAALSQALQQIGLDVEDKLSEMGVTSASDVLELEKEDLQGIGLNLVQIRKLQNALKGGAPKAGGIVQQAAKLQQVEQVTSPSGAPLQRTKADNDFYACDGCGKSIPKGQPLFSSREANYDLCMACAGVGNGAKNGGGGGAAAKKPPKDCKWCRLGECWTPNCPTKMYMASNGGGFGGGFGWAGMMGGGVQEMDATTFAKQKFVHNTTPFKRKFLEFAEGDVDVLSAQSARSDLELAIDGGPEGTDNYHAPVATFEELDQIPKYCIEALNENSITTPMPIQAQALPICLSGHDLVGVAKTGSGKTLAYLLPAVVHIEAQEPVDDTDLTPIAIILAPTRELAVQIHEEAQKLLSKSDQSENHPGGLKACCIYGGMKKDGQLRQAMGCHIVAATPGRLHEHVMKSEMSMERVTYFVLDEGDRMLEEGFESQVKVIANAIRPDRHMLFFSATWPANVHKLAKAMCSGKKPPVRLRVGQNQDGSAKTREDIVQEVVVFDSGTWEQRDKEKKELVYAHVREALNMPETKILVFVSRKDLCEEVSRAFNAEGFETDTMHGGKTQDRREQVLENFKNGECRLLITTDVMGRGLDIPTITHVVIYDMGDVDDYVHRIGRTARGPHGEGHALTLFEYDPRWPHIAEGLISVMERANQDVPDELRQIATEVSEGKREVGKLKGRYGSQSGHQGGYDAIVKKQYGDVAGMLAKW